jgi:hemolysin activation/secretion protein
MLSASLTQGLGGLFGGTENRSALTSRPGADDLFTKANVEWTRVRSIHQPYFIPHPFSLLLSGSAQISSNRLVVGEQFVVGGPDSVRGYPVGESLGDHGYRLSSEIRISPFTDPEKIQAAFFIDHGGGFTRENEHFLTGIGFGARFNYGSLVILREPDTESQAPGYNLHYRFHVRADLGFPVGDRFVSQSSGPVFYLQAVGRF